MSNYEVLVNENNRFELVDRRDVDQDMSRFTARTTSTWKKIVTAGQRRYSSASVNLHNGHTYILTYAKGRLAIVNPGKGDYIPPGFERVSQPLERLFQGWDGQRCVSRSRLVPINGNFLINPTLTSNQSQFCTYRGQGTVDYVKGWSIYTSGSEGSYYRYIRYTAGSGLICREASEIAVAIQTVVKEVLEGRTRIRLRCPGTNLVMLGVTPLTRGEDNVWTWEGEALTEDTLLTIEINGVTHSGNVELLDD